MKKKNYKHKVFCDGCAFLLYIPDMGPLCLADSDFCDGPLRDRVDLVGMTSAIKKNLYNDCSQRCMVSRKAWELKKWVLKRMGDGSERIKAGKLSDYSVEEEARSKKRHLSEEYSEVKAEESYDYEVEWVEDEEISYSEEPESEGSEEKSEAVDGER